MMHKFIKSELANLRSGSISILKVKSPIGGADLTQYVVGELPVFV